MKKETQWTKFRADWHVLTLYQRFEGLVAIVLTSLVALIIVGTG